MALATFNKFEKFTEDLCEKVHNLAAAGDTLKVYLSNTPPSASADAVKADLAEITNENGYAAPIDVQNDTSRTGGVTSVTGLDITIIASGGTIGPFRYVVLYNDTPTSPLDPLIGWWDNGSEVTLADGEEFVIDIGTSLFTVT